MKMKNNKEMSTFVRALLILGSLMLIAVLYFPIWQIELTAPQYPEGLALLIYANRLGGNVDIINGLNHYIGMKTLHTADFFEFTILPYIIGVFALLLLLVAVTGKKAFLNAVFVLFVCFGIVAMIDFWRWNYNYGHNLNPDAPIVVPGMAYQPPLIGFKQLLNFGAYSIPDSGGWLFIGVGIILLLLVIFGWKSAYTPKIKCNPVAGMLLLGFIFVLQSCNTEPQQMIIGKDVCSYCKMLVSDNRFGAEIITDKGKIYKFDDAHCILSFLNEPDFQNNKKYRIYFVDFSGNHSLIPASASLFLKTEALKSPMNGNIAAFRNTDSLQVAFNKYSGSKLTWSEVNRP